MSNLIVKAIVWFMDEADPGFDLVIVVAVVCAIVFC